ncbi:Protein CBG28074 [Caenorhabditis briggsae]|uniref:Protein CBG28074 n=1 Tax=Caenorhabditis briggsae TaxID=6238 RepID=B6IGR4_CAEBR|nr:Protein CBG28074 [Caenorhabditis briggsae]CAR99094.1 Protein CBG28074 [Caenorhabditis briggsae]
MVEKLMNRKTIEWISDLQLKLPGGLLRTSQTNPKDILSPPDRPKCKLVALPPPAKKMRSADRVHKSWLRFCRVLQLEGFCPPVFNSDQLMEFLSSQILPDESHTIEPLATEKEIWDRVTERLVPGNFRAQHLIQDLLKPRPELCKKCSFKNNDPRYQKQETRDHIDQHTRDSLDEIPRFWRKDSKAVVKSQEWYPSEKDWLCAKKSKLMENTTIVHKDVPTAESTNKSCSICFEKFVEYYDDEDEVWRLRQSMEYNKGVVHTYCMEVDNKGVGTV